jgi:S1-C subfamily serine protease
VNRRPRISALSAIVAGAALVGVVAGGAVGLAFDGGSGASAADTELAPAPARPLHALSPETIYRNDAPGVVVITATQTQNVPGTEFTPPGKRKVRVLGSGFVVDRAGDIVTNEHVVENGSDVTVGFSAGATYSAKVLGTDASTDLAVIRIDAPRSALHPLELADSGQVQVGDTVYAIGNPFGLDRTMTAGIVSALGRDIQAPNGLSIPDAIQTDAAINHGNSGGPLLDTRGAVIGINDQIESGGSVDGNVGVGFAVASDTIRATVPHLIATGRAPHAWLGVEVAQIDPQVAAAIGSLPAHGVLVVAVVKRSPAAQAGLKAGTRQVTVDGQSALLGGDVIVSADGKQIRSPAQLSSFVSAHMPGDSIRLEVSRDGHSRTIQVKLGDAP